MPGVIHHIKWKDPSARPPRSVERFTPSRLSLPSLDCKIGELRKQIPIVEYYLRRLKKEWKGKKGYGAKTLECQGWLETARLILAKAERCYDRRTREAAGVAQVWRPFSLEELTQPERIAEKKLDAELIRKKVFSIWKRKMIFDVTIRWELGEWIAEQEELKEKSPLEEILNWNSLTRNMKLDYRLLLQMNLAQAAKKAVINSLREEEAIQHLCKVLRISEQELQSVLEMM